MAALYAALAWITPLILDDWVYLTIWRDNIGLSEGFSLKGFWRYISIIREVDNGRISNITAPLEFLFSPTKELFPIVTGIMVALSAVMVQRLATGKPNVLYLSVTWLFFILFLPWSDTLFANIYSYNYIWPGFITLCLLCALRRFETRGWQPLTFAGTLVLAILAGGWHEAFAAATLCGLGLLILVRRFRFSWQFFCVVALYLASALLFILSPGMIARMGSDIGRVFFFLSKAYFYILPLLGILILVCLTFRKGRRALGSLLTDNVAIVAAGIIIAGYFIAFTAGNTPRSAYWPNMACILLAGRILWKLDIRFRPAAATTLAAALLAICTAQTIAAIVWQKRYTEDYDNIMALLAKSETGTVFYDSPNPVDEPRYTMRIPIANIWRNPWHYAQLNTYLEKPTIGVVPTTLRDATLKESAPLPGADNLSLYKGHIISPPLRPEDPSEPLLPQQVTVLTIMPDGRLVDGWMLAIPFVTERNDTLEFYTKFL